MFSLAWSNGLMILWVIHQVRVAFNQSSASPGDSINVTTVTSPGSVVLLSVIDKSLTLLADACKSLESGNVRKSMKGQEDGDRLIH